jgi:hypothetical protein
MQELVLNEVYDIWPTSFWQTLPGYAILAILGIGIFLLGYAIYKMVIAYQEGTSKDKALRSLKELSKKVQSSGTSDSRGVYQELTDIIKGFARWRYLIPLGTTDYELVDTLKEVGCTKEQCQGVERIMIDAQGVKFGQSLAPKDQVLKDIEVVTLFVEVAGERPKGPLKT